MSGRVQYPALPPVHDPALSVALSRHYMPTGGYVQVTVTRYAGSAAVGYDVDAFTEYGDWTWHASPGGLSDLDAGELIRLVDVARNAAAGGAA